MGSGVPMGPGLPQPNFLSKDRTGLIRLTSYKARRAGPGWAALVGAGKGRLGPAGMAALVPTPYDNKCTTDTDTYFDLRMISSDFVFDVICGSLGIYHIQPTAANIPKPDSNGFRYRIPVLTNRVRIYSVMLITPKLNLWRKGNPTMFYKMCTLSP